ncbi:hypothetical protein BKA62DRAFT_694778 [Auriculariales sp. MPI-PUGE-AT-0066]|nr:hypothetical protein BKA62DRAFT_694778 [Auriculariales sp. MPI-PUGE-AT-0066]
MHRLIPSAPDFGTRTAKAHRNDRGPALALAAFLPRPRPPRLLPPQPPGTHAPSSRSAMPTQIAIPNSVVLYFATALSESLFQGIILSQLSTYLATSACMRGTTPLGPQAKDSISSPRLININRTTDGWDRDRWWGLRGYTLLVFFVCALETAFQIVRCWTFIENAAEWMRTSEISTNVIVTVLVQAFFINRCWKASKNIFILAYLTLLVLGQIAISVCMTVALRGEYGRIVYGGKVAQDQDGHRNFIIWVLPFFALVPVLVDLSITIILIMYFKRWRTGLPASDALLRHVSYLAFEAAALPTLARLAAGVGWLAKAHSLAVVCGMLPAKLYVISYLRALNARPKLRERAHAVHGRETLGTEDDTVEFTVCLIRICLVEEFHMRTRSFLGTRTRSIGRRQ